MTISPRDYICSTCYKTHCLIIESLKSPHGSDTSLKQAINQWVDQYDDGNTDKLTKATLQTVIYVANHLLQEKAVLLPWACKVFLKSYESEYAGSVTSAKVTVETGDGTVIFSARWLLHKLIEYLNCYMLCKCVHMKFGTILYRKGVDVLVSLSWALSTQSTSQECSDEDHNCVHRPVIEDNKTVLHNSACIVNSLIHKEIQRQSTVRREFSTNPLSFSIEDQLQNMDQLLVGFVDHITATVREKMHQSLRKESKASKQLKNIRMYNVLSLLQFCTNPNQPLLFHDLLADAVEMCGGSRELLKILNNLGCTSSPDIHDRFIAYHAAEQRKRYLWDDLSPSAFTIASVDNFDMLQSYSAVYCGNQHRSYHGTTVQIVQPNPNNKICFNNEEQTCTPALPLSCSISISDDLHGASDNLPDMQTVSKRAFSSPDISPDKVSKAGPKPKRQRTVAVRNLTSTLTCVSDTNNNLYPKPLAMVDFEESKEEADEHLPISRELFLTSYLNTPFTTNRIFTAT